MNITTLKQAQERLAKGQEFTLTPIGYGMHRRINCGPLEGTYHTDIMTATIARAMRKRGHVAVVRNGYTY
jgi:hypothetical protein